MVKRLPIIAGIGVILLLTACSGGSPTPTPAPPSAAPPTSATTTPPAAPTTAPTTAPPASPPTSAITAGDCTLAESTVVPIPVVYTVYTTDSTTPVTIQYTAFNHDGSNPTRSETTVGPVVNIIGYPCTDAAGSATWTLKATTTTSNSVGCVLDFGGILVRNDSQGAESGHPIPIHVNCSGNPGE